MHHALIHDSLNKIHHIDPPMPYSRYRPLKAAAEWARAQGLNSFSEWKAKCSIPGWLPPDIPSNPYKGYGQELKALGGVGEFLGTGRIGPMSRKWRSFKQAMRWAQAQNVGSLREWNEKVQQHGWLPSDIPRHPNIKYREEFKKIGWGGFLATGNVAPSKREFRSLKEAGDWAKNQGVVSSTDWFERCQTKGWRPYDIPVNIRNVYGSEAFENIGGWNGFLGVSRLSQTSLIEKIIRVVLDECFDPGANAMKKIHLIGASGKKYAVDMAYDSVRIVLEYDGAYFHKGNEHKDQVKRRDLEGANHLWRVIRIREAGLKLLDSRWDVQVNPKASTHERVKVVADHLLLLNSTGNIDLSEHQKTFLQQNNFSSVYEKKMALLIRLSGWRSLDEATAWASEKNISSIQEWRKMCALDGWRPDDIPSNPSQVYENNFRKMGGWGAFLGSGRVATFNREYRSFEEARMWAQQQGFSGRKQWMKKCKESGWLPTDIPANIPQVYAEKFHAHGGWGGFLGTGTVCTRNRSFLSLEEATRWASIQGIKNHAEWIEKTRQPGWLPDNIPMQPWATYGKSFKTQGGMGAFLGTGTVAPQNRIYRSAEEAFKWARVQGLKSQVDWKIKCKDKTWLPADIPANPYAVYGRETFNTLGGWTGFLGNNKFAILLAARRGEEVSLPRSSRRLVRS